MPFPRLYAILDFDLLTTKDLQPGRVLDAWLEAGVRLVQLRAKTMASGAMLELAETIARRCRQAGAIFIVNDRVDVASLADADGVHLGQDDLSPADARQMLPAAAIVGRSMHTEAQATAACHQPISYLAMGPVFATASKAKPDPVVGLEGVAAAARLAADRRLPVVAIGGITLDRAPSVIAAGATSVAVIADLLQGDVQTRARAFMDALGS